MIYRLYKELKGKHIIKYDFMKIMPVGEAKQNPQDST